MSNNTNDSLVERIKDYSTEYLKYIINLGTVEGRYKKLHKNATRETLEQYAFLSMLNLFNEPTKIKEQGEEVNGK